MFRQVQLLSCVGRKRSVPAPARDLYTSSWFRKARNYADSTGQPWFVLSAKHGLVHPDQVVAPYDLTLNAIPKPGRCEWASRVLAQLGPHLDGVDSVVILAGRRYREFLEPSLRGRGLAVCVPMEGMRIGEQLRWLTGMCAADRLGDTVRFYELLDHLADRVGGPRFLRSCSAGMSWPRRGVYFFYENGESRSGSGGGPRVVRVGAHALRHGSRSTLWGRLSQHRGTSRSGLGNHRGSVFRLLVGVALASRGDVLLPESWGVAGTADSSAEADIEASVSEYIGQMPFVWMSVDDEPGPNSSRGFIERNAIAILSGYGRPAIDGPSGEWLGRFSDRERVRLSGLWNNNHVDEAYDPSFLDDMEYWVDANLP